MQFRNVNLSPDLDEFVLNSLESGHYSNVSELVQAALRALDHEERMKKIELASTSRQIDPGTEDIRESDVFRKLWELQFKSSRDTTGQGAE